MEMIRTGPGGLHWMQALHQSERHRRDAREFRLPVCIEAVVPRLASSMLAPCRLLHQSATAPGFDEKKFIILMKEETRFFSIIEPGFSASFEKRRPLV